MISYIAFYSSHKPRFGNRVFGDVGDRLVKYFRKWKRIRLTLKLNCERGTEQSMHFWVAVISLDLLIYKRSELLYGFSHNFWEITEILRIKFPHGFFVSFFF